MRKDRAKNKQTLEPKNNETNSEPESEFLLDELSILKEPIHDGIIELRQLILHPKGLVDKVKYNFDDHPDSAHFVIRSGDEVVAVGTVLPEDEDGHHSSTHWRIRGMAVGSDFQGQGLGSILLEEIFEHIAAFKVTPKRIWCNARVEALNLYARAGFEVLDGEFIIEGSGPHRRLHRNLV